jgi:hypothetical protein
VDGDDSIMKMGELLRYKKSTEKDQRNVPIINWRIYDIMNGDKL